MRGLKPTSLLILLLSLLAISLLPSPVPIQAQTDTYFRGRNCEGWSHAFGGGNVTFRLPDWVWNGLVWVPYIYQNRSADRGCHVLRNGLIAVEVYPYYAMFFDVNYTETRLHMEQWSIEQLNPKNGKWSAVVTPSPSLPPTSTLVVQNSSGIFLTQTYANWGGWLNVTYALREGAALKHIISFKSAIPEIAEFRVVMSWSGIVGNKVYCKTGTYEITGSTQLNSTWYAFQKPGDSLSVFEDLLSSIQFNQLAVVDVHPQGMKASFTFQNSTLWAINENETLHLDPDTYTFTPLDADNYLYEESASQHYNYGGSTSLHVLSYATNRDKRSILKVDTSGQIPSGSTINVATFSMYYYGILGLSPVGRTYYVYRLSETDWVGGTSDGASETGASDWVCRQHATLTWSSAGGSYTGTPASATVPSSYGWMDWTVTAQVQYAVDNVAGVVHFLVKDSVEENTDGRGAMFYSKEGSTKPKLYVEWTPPNTAPTIGGFQAPSTVYANQYVFLNATINDDDGVADFVNATIEISQDIILKWDNATNTFSEYSDANGYCTLNASASVKASVNSTAYKLSWSLCLNSYPSGSADVVVTNTKVFDSEGASGSNSQSGLFTFSYLTLVLQARTEDSVNVPRAVTYKVNLGNGTDIEASSNSTGYYSFSSCYGTHAINTWWGTHLVNASLSYLLSGDAAVDVDTYIQRLVSGSNYALFSLNSTALPSPELTDASLGNWRIESVTATGTVSFKMDSTNWIATSEPAKFYYGGSTATNSDPDWSWTGATHLFLYPVPFSTITLSMTWEEATTPSDPGVGGPTYPVTTTTTTTTTTPPGDVLPPAGLPPTTAIPSDLMTLGVVVIPVILGLAIGYRELERRITLPGMWLDRQVDLEKRVPWGKQQPKKVRWKRKPKFSQR